MDLRDHTVAIKDQIQASRVGGHLQELLSKGKTDLNGGAWRGDPWLTLCWNKLENRWEIFDEKNERPRRVCRGPVMVGDKRPDHSTFLSVLMHLRDHDHRNFTTDQILNRIDDYNDVITKAKEAAHRDNQVEALSKVYWGAAKDIGHLY